LIALSGCTKNSDLHNFKVLTEASQVLIEDKHAMIIPGGEAGKIYVKVSDAELLRLVTLENTGKVIYIELNGRLLSKQTVTREIQGGLIELEVVGGEKSFKGEEEAVRHLLIK
jgi:hypothetical protein